VNNSNIIRSDRRSIALEIQSDGNLVIRAPRHVSHSFIQKLLRKKQQWIIEKQQILRERQSKATPKQYVQGEEFYYLGKSYKLDIKDSFSVPIDFNSGFRISARYKDNIKELIKQWYRQQAKKIIPQCVKQIADSHSFEFTNIKITSAEKRWGSCTGKKTLNFSWRIIMLPPDIIEYIVLHELAHLKELNHSKNFWLEVKQMLPDYKKRKKWLRDNSYKFRL
jgi:predicted metal-dependent hydrolase